VLRIDTDDIVLDDSVIIASCIAGQPTKLLNVNLKMFMNVACTCTFRL
jgi:hypothetical protein